MQMLNANAIIYLFEYSMVDNESKESNEELILIFSETIVELQIECLRQHSFLLQQQLQQGVTRDVAVVKPKMEINKDI